MSRNIHLQDAQKHTLLHFKSVIPARRDRSTGKQEEGEKESEDRAKHHIGVEQAPSAALCAQPQQTCQTLPAPGR